MATKRDKVFLKTGGRCAYCGKELVNTRRDWQMEHIVPVSQGGLSRLDNLLPSCKTCNKRKLNRNLEEWRARQSGQMIISFEQAQERLNAIRASGMTPDWLCDVMEQSIQTAIDIAAGLPITFYFERQGE